MDMAALVQHDARCARTAEPAAVAQSHPHSLQKRVDASTRQLVQGERLAQLHAAPARRNPNGLPQQLRAGIEALSGMDMGDVVVHRNSAQPAQLNALAYAQGNQIHLGPGQEKHLAHEAWHVVQQRQGRVKPTKQMKDGVSINDDQRLEREADVMGLRAQGGGQAVMRKPEKEASLAAPVQRLEGEVRREVPLEQLPEADTRKRLMSSFKKSSMGGPMVDSADKLVQRRPKKESWGGGDLFTVLKSDLNTGTGTSKGTREYVNSPGTYKPSSVLFDYGADKSAIKAKYKVTINKNAYEVDNSEADYSYKSGSLWDAGHKLGRQNGGLGDDNDWVFPQNPAFNQGNSRNMDDVEETYPLWREHENTFHQGVKDHGSGVWWIKLV
ncbi:DUF4157 domain-containing protein [Fulvimonas sp. R45]|uniref:eCIS core domain-containing protein n=1 Tax=Fulvimonas sp. R45 TaxID=3045937 RepID=UPI0026604872|nr:DUF4157 domain-containing protein [Fulvimonas sp. R45]MDO1529057.1 DUF4157 domain-containing protein [Fulvimonas sp. R45]